MKFKKKMILIVIVSAFIGFIYYFIFQGGLLFLSLIIPDINSSPSSNQAWVPNSDKLGYFQTIDYSFNNLVNRERYRIVMLFHVRSLSNPFSRKTIKWVIPKSQWNTFLYPAHFSFSPKGDKIVFDSGGNIYIYDLRKKGPFEKIIENGRNPEWSPDGKSIVYESVRQDGYFSTDDNKMSMYRREWTNPNRIFDYSEINIGKDKIKLIALIVGKDPKWSFDSSKLIFTTGDRIFIATPDGKSIKYINVPFERVAFPSFSPDGERVVFCALVGYRKLGRNLCICDAQTGELMRVLYKAGANCNSNAYNVFVSNPMWSPRGRTIAYIFSCEDTRVYLIEDSDTGLKKF